MKAAGVLMSTAGAPGLAVALTREAAAVPKGAVLSKGLNRCRLHTPYCTRTGFRRGALEAHPSGR